MYIIKDGEERNVVITEWGPEKEKQTAAVHAHMDREKMLRNK